MGKKVDFRKFFAFWGLFLVGFNFWAILLAVFGVFHKTLLLAYPFGFAAYFGFLIFKKQLDFSALKIPKDFMIAAAVSLAAVLFLCANTTPSFFSGRDQGSFSEAAIRLEQNHRLKFKTPASEEFSKLYGPGKALNFPGFDYAEDGKLTPHFPVGYIAWLAAFYSFFGSIGLASANGATFFMFLLSFYLLIKSCASRRAAFAALLLIFSSFVYSWFFKLTLSENLALFLVWFGIFEFTVFLKKRDYFFLLAGLFSFFVMAFSRVEAFAFLGAALAILFFARKHLKNTGSSQKKILWAGGISACLFYLLNILINFAYYKTILKGVFGSFAKDENLPGQTFWDSFSYTLKVFNEYAILDFFLLFILAVFYFLYKKKYELFVPLVLFLPTFIYIFHPGISFDHPWMLRRHIFSVIPGCVFVSVWFLDSFFKKKLYLYLFFGLLFANNIFVSLPYLTFAENKTLLRQTEKIIRDFDGNDLILFDREASGDPFSMISGPANFIFGKNSAYLFNPEDLKKLDTDRFENVYLVIPDKNLFAYQNDFLFDKLVFQRDYMIIGERLAIVNLDRGELWRSRVDLPKKEPFSLEGKIYLLDKNKL